MAGTSGSPTHPREKWLAPHAGVHYAGKRWRSERRANRDPLLVSRILAKHGVRPSRGGVLDAPCGAGRLAAAMGPGHLGLDISRSMLEEARRGGLRRLCRGDLEHLPFPGEAFDVVVACRILHHLDREEDLRAVARELVRVSSRLVVASFWDPWSVPALRRSLLSRKRDPMRRRSHPRSLMERVFEAAGAPVIEYRHSFRFLSQQVFLVARKTGSE